MVVRTRPVGENGKGVQMRWQTIAAGLALAVLAGAAEARAQQQPTYAKGVTATPVLENERVRVVRVRFEPGGEEAVHTHEYDLLTIAVTAAEIEMTREGATTRLTRAPGDTGFVPKGVAHGARNVGSGPIEILAVVLK